MTDEQFVDALLQSKGQVKENDRKTGPDNL
jgi:hypothetical protein